MAFLAAVTVLGGAAWVCLKNRSLGSLLGRGHEKSKD
jgi:hypothetical protein